MTTDIDAIRQREQAATSGPWFAIVPADENTEWFDPYDDPMVVTSDSTPGSYCAIAQDICNGANDGAADAEFIAAARTDVPALLAEVDELTAELAKTRDALTQSRQQAATYANEIGALTAENARLRPVVEAAKAWRGMRSESANVRPKPEAAALIAAVDALPKAATI